MAPRILIFSIAMGANHLFYVKFITYYLSAQIFGYIISVLASVIIMDSILFWIRICENNFSAIGSKPIETKFRVVKSGATIHQVFHQKKTQAQKIF